MDDSVRRAIDRLTELLRDLSRRDEQLRADLVLVAQALLNAVDRHDSPISEPAAGLGRADPGDTLAEATAAVEAESSPPAPLPELTLGRSTPISTSVEVPTPWQSHQDVDDADLKAIAARCRLKAEGLHWAWERRRAYDAGGAASHDAVAKDREVIDRARALGCQLWMNTPHFRLPPESGPLFEAAGCFETVAAGLEALQALVGEDAADESQFRQGLELLAEAQSGLRVAVHRLDGRKDPDQFAVYSWLRNVAHREQIYIPRFMTLDQPADPSAHFSVMERIRRLESDRGHVRSQDRKRKSLLGKLRYHARRARGDLADDHDWARINETLDQLVAGGEPPSSVEIREVVAPIVDRMPDLEQPSRGLTLFLREVDDFLASRRPTPEEEAEPQEPANADVAEVAQLLEGKAVVLIGGACRPEADKALREAFRLKELFWIETREHESIERFKPVVARPDVALVILAIRWSSHAFSDIKPYCDQHAKPLLRLPRGYNPNQVAREILDQCSDRLRDAPEQSEG